MESSTSSTSPSTSPPTSPSRPRSPKRLGVIVMEDVVADLRAMTTRAVAEKYGVSVSTIHRIRRKAGVPGHAPGHPSFKLV